MNAEAMPNWRPVDVHPLHATPIPHGCFWACENPERPWDATCTCWDWRCYACFRHGEATLRHHPEIKIHHGVNDEGTWSNTPSWLAFSVEDARKYHGVPA